MPLEKYHYNQVLRRSKKRDKPNEFMLFKSENCFNSLLNSQKGSPAERTLNDLQKVSEKLNNSYEHNITEKNGKYFHRCDEDPIPALIIPRAISSSTTTLIKHLNAIQKIDEKEFKLSITKVHIDDDRFKLEDIKILGKIKLIATLENKLKKISLILLLVSVISVLITVTDVSI